MKLLKNKHNANQYQDSIKDEEEKNKEYNYYNHQSEDTSIIPLKRTVAKLPYLQNIQLYEKVILYCDAPFDIRYFSNQTFYDEEYQQKYKQIRGVKDYKNDKIVFLDFDTMSTQVKDPSHLIKQLKTLSSQEAYNMALQIEKNYELYQQQLRIAQHIESKGNKQIMERELIMQKTIEVVKKVSKNSSKFILINVLSMDFEAMEMKKIMAGGTYELGKVILSKKDQLLKSMMKLKNFNIGGDMKNFTKHQFPDCEERDIPICLHTIDGFILPCTSRLHTIPLDENNLNVVMLKQFIIDPILLDRLTDFRQKMSSYGIESLITENMYGDKQYINLSHQSVEGLQFEQFSFSAEQFKLSENNQISNNNYFSQNNLQPNQFNDDSNSCVILDQNRKIRKGLYEDYKYQQAICTLPKSQHLKSSSSGLNVVESEINSSSDENNMFGAEGLMMNFEPPQFEMNGQLSEEINQNANQDQQFYEHQSDYEIQHNFNNRKQYLQVLEEQKKNAIAFINKFYSPLIK